MIVSLCGLLRVQVPTRLKTNYILARHVSLESELEEEVWETEWGIQECDLGYKYYGLGTYSLRSNMEPPANNQIRRLYRLWQWGSMGPTLSILSKKV